jgi:hypothetical protein
MQYMVQCSNIYGSVSAKLSIYIQNGNLFSQRLGFWHWAKVIFPVFIMYTTPIFNSFDEVSFPFVMFFRADSFAEAISFIEEEQTIYF